MDGGDCRTALATPGLLNISRNTNTVVPRMNGHIVPAGTVMLVEINFRTSGNTWTKSTKNNKPYTGTLPDVLGQNTLSIWIQGIKTHLNLDAHF